MLCDGAADRDPRQFTDPDEILLDRPPVAAWPSSLVSTSTSVPFDRPEFEIVLRSVLARMLVSKWNGRVVGSNSVGLVAGWLTTPATFTPGPRVDTDPRAADWKYCTEVEGSGPGADPA